MQSASCASMHFLIWTLEVLDQWSNSTCSTKRDTIVSPMATTRNSFCQMLAQFIIFSVGQFCEHWYNTVISNDSQIFLYWKCLLSANYS
jgi:hypothetical protein